MKGFLLFFLKFYFFMCEVLQGNEDVDSVKNTNKFHVMRGDIYLHETTARGLLFSKILL